ncbi:MAG TPA: universal stress protein [Acidimicrobiales bacterium]|nr:universal stress protein [Acidimicrobiales bacterium]
MFEKLLVAVDQSEHSDRAVDVACDLARLSGAEILVLHVKKVVLGFSGDLLEAEDESEIGVLLEKAANRFEEIGVPVSVQIRTAETGRIAHQIVVAATDFGADAIVMGSRGRSAVSAFVLGSVAQGVLHLAKQRVLVVH